ncbi:MAG: hypothetical protein ACXVNQ_10410, partial [Bacteroidia bacterium]
SSIPPIVELVVLPDLLFDFAPEVDSVPFVECVPLVVPDPLVEPLLFISSIVLPPFVTFPFFVEDESVVDVVELVSGSVIFVDVLVKAKRAIVDAIHVTKKMFFFMVKEFLSYTNQIKILYQRYNVKGHYRENFFPDETKRKNTL